MARYITIPDVAREFQKNARSIELWIGHGFIAGYDDGSGKIRVDSDEIERALKTNPRMRDGRKKYGPNAKIVPMPILSDGADQ